MRYVFAVYVSKVVSRRRNQKLICIRYFLDLQIRYGKKVLRTFDVDAKGEFLENFFQPTTPSDAA